LAAELAVRAVEHALGAGADRKVDPIGGFNWARLGLFDRLQTDDAPDPAPHWRTPAVGIRGVTLAGAAGCGAAAR